MKTTAIGLLGLIALIGNMAAAQNTPQMELPRIKLSAGIHLIDTQVAASPEQRSTGLMFRKDMPQSEGMLLSLIHI